MNFSELIQQDIRFDKIVTSFSEKKVRTPIYFDLILFLVDVFDFNIGKDGRAVSDLRLNINRARACDEVLSSLAKIIGLNSGQAEYVRGCLLRLENVVELIHREPLFSSCSQGEGAAKFFKIVTLPLLMEITDEILLSNEIPVLREFKRMSWILYDNDSGTLVKEVKREVRQSLEGVDAPLAKVRLGKLVPGTYFKLSSINKLCEEIPEHALAGGESVSHVVMSKLIAARIIYKCLELRGRLNDVAVSLDTNGVECCTVLARNYICNERASVLGVSNELNAVEFAWRYIFNRFKDSVNCIDPSDKYNLHLKLCNVVPDEYVVWEMVVFFENAVIAAGMKHVVGLNIDNVQSSFLKVAEFYQIGNVARVLSALLIGLKVNDVAKIPPNSLNPLVSVVVEYGFGRGAGVFRFSTPFGMDSSIESTDSVNFQLAVGLCNELILENNLGFRLCNPLRGLERLLVLLFNCDDRGVALDRAEVEKISPLVGMKVNFYDALKSINKYLFRFSLVKDFLEAPDGFRCQSSLLGRNVNKYLALDDQKKLHLLSLIDRDAYCEDLNLSFC